MKAKTMGFELAGWTFVMFIFMFGLLCGAVFF